jgi:hypothetical protein
MINTNFVPTKGNGKYSVYYFQNIIEQLFFDQLKTVVPSYAYNFINGKRTDAVKRIWLHQSNNEYLSNLASAFDTLEIKDHFGKYVNTDFTKMRTRIELCNDLEGSWLEEHVDDPAKKFTLQFYLSNIERSTMHNGQTYDAIENNGWFFLNTGTEYHSLSPLKARRSSIILNYVDNSWRDDTVLVS